MTSDSMFSFKNVTFRRSAVGMAGMGRKYARWCAHCPLIPPEAVETVGIRCECGKRKPAFALPNSDSPRWCAQCPTKPIEAMKPLPSLKRFRMDSVDPSTAVFDTSDGMDSPGTFLHPPTVDLFSSPTRDADTHLEDPSNI